MPIKTVRIKFDKLMATTARAYLLRFYNTEMWFPKRFCRQFITNNKLGGNCVIPAWLYKEKFAEDPEESQAETIIEHHIPAKLEPMTPQTDASLTRPTT